MKTIVVLCLIAAVYGEAPRRAGSRALPSLRAARFRSQRFEIVPTTTDSPTEDTTPAEGYPPSGWRPAGTSFQLPNETKAPNDSYGAPIINAPYPTGWIPVGKQLLLPQEQSPPATNYGVPVKSFSATTTDAPISAAENLQVEGLSSPVDVQKSVGTYYVLLPNGQLQKVEFLTENDVQNMKYSARLQLRDRAPLYFLGR